MKMRCVSCGSVASLDVWAASEQSMLSLKRAFDSTTLGFDLLRYLALHRPAKRELSIDRAMSLLAELLPDIERGQITYNRLSYPAPPDAWRWAIGQMLEARAEQRLTLPLKGHGYLYAVLTGFRPDRDSAPVQGAAMALPHAALPHASVQAIGDTPRWAQAGFKSKTKE